MPRGSTGSSSKRQGLLSNNSNNSSSSNSNSNYNNGGLVPPHKRPIRSRSSSGAAQPAFAVASASASTPTIRQPAVVAPQVSTTAAAAQFYSSANGMDMGAHGWHHHGKGQSFYDCIADEGSDGFGDGRTPTATEHHKIDLNPSHGSGGGAGGTGGGGSGAVGGGAGGAGGGIAGKSLDSTVLKSFPLLDTITLLIVFLQIPPTILTLIHSLFFLQTFVPPSTTLFSLSTASMPSFTNFLLQGSNGSPSLLTIMFADCILASVSLFLWPLAWNFLIDFAQAIIAMTLGAGTATGDSLRNVAVCAGVMGGVKAAQGRFWFSGAWDGLQPDRQLQHVPQILSGREEGAGWVRTCFAIHIVAQAVMRATRRWLIRRPESAPDAASAGSISPGNAKDAAPAAAAAAAGTLKQKDKDPEAAVGSSPGPPTTTAATATATATTTILDSSATAGGGTGKRKRKTQVQSVRNNQPLWATMASAVIHVAKEVERSQLSSEASNTKTGSLAGPAPSDQASGPEDSSSVWITKIGSTEIGFVVGCVDGLRGEEGPYAAGGGSYSANGGMVAIDGAGRDSRFPFFVRVNGIVWPQTDISAVPKLHDMANPADSADAIVLAGEVDDEWAVNVTGLTGSTEYDFEFARRDGGAVFYSTSACTMPAQGRFPLSAAAAMQSANPLCVEKASALPTVTQQPSRPLSPVTTLLHSLAQANSSLAETKSQLKSIRKTHKASLSEIRREIEKHRGLIGNDRGEERAFRRNLALKESIKRAEEEAEAMASKLADLKQRPEKMKPEWEAKKNAWQAEKRQLSAAQARAAEDKAATDRQVATVESEAASLATKKEKLAARLGKLRVDLSKLDSEHSEGSDSKEKRRAEREASEKRRQSLENDFVDVIQQLDARIKQYAAHTQSNLAQCQALAESALLHAAPAPPDRPVLHLAGNRERSSSLFSDGSVITNLSEVGHPALLPAAFGPLAGPHGSAEHNIAPGMGMGTGMGMGMGMGLAGRPGESEAR